MPQCHSWLLTFCWDIPWRNHYLGCPLPSWNRASFSKERIHHDLHRNIYSCIVFHFADILNIRRDINGTHACIQFSLVLLSKPQCISASFVFWLIYYAFDDENLSFGLLDTDQKWKQCLFWVSVCPFVKWGWLYGRSLTTRPHNKALEV